MEESKYSQYVLDQFDHYFSKKWIDQICKKKNVTVYRSLFEKTESFLQLMISQYARLALSGDHLINGIETVDVLRQDNRFEVLLEDEPNGDNTIEKSIIDLTYGFLQDINNATRLIKYHAETTKRYFENNNEVLAVEGIKFDRENSGNPVLIGLLEQICDICDDEYNFSYDKSYIQKLVISRAQLLLYDPNDFSSEVYGVISATIKKVEFLLSKLALYSDGESISYNLDFKTQKITLDNYDEEGSDAEFRQLYRYFYAPDLIPDDVAIQWTENLAKPITSMWRSVYLMRYYCKHTHSKKQIDRLITVGQSHFETYLHKTTRNIVDDKSERFFINYLYNSRFSFLCKDVSTYPYASMKEDLEQIKMIQNNTGIHNYHPYQQACNYLVVYITEKLRNTNYTESLKEEWGLLNDCYAHLKQNVEWCARHQPYLMPFHYRFSTIKSGDVLIYFPSSISRPLKFKEIADEITKIGGAVQWLELQIDHQSEKKELLEAREQIGKMEISNIKHMGYFITVTTFFVGLLAIFIGNNGGVSIFEKMEYVVTLGVILILFVCVGYIAITENIKNKNKYWIIFASGLLLAVILGWLSHVGYQSLNDKKNSTDVSSIKTESKLELNLDTIVVKMEDGHRKIPRQSVQKATKKP